MSKICSQKKKLGGRNWGLHFMISGTESERRRAMFEVSIGNQKAGSIYLFPVFLEFCQLIPGSPQLSSHFSDLRQRRKFGKALRQSLSELLAAFPRSPKAARVCRSPQTRRKVLALSESEGWKAPSFPLEAEHPPASTSLSHCSKAILIFSKY